VFGLVSWGQILSTAKFSMDSQLFFFKATRKSSKELARPAKWVDFFM
jgi:hypothetical protein